MTAKNFKIKRKIAKWGAFKSKFFATTMNVLNKLYLTNRKIEKLTHKKNIHYAKNKKCAYDIIYTKNYPQKKLPTIFLIHGGSYIAVDKKQFTHLAKDFASAGFLVVNINYRLMPEVYIKDCAQDCINAVKHVLNSCDKIDRNNCFFIGDSAGANLACKVIYALKSKKSEIKINIRASLFLYGFFDARITNKLTKPFIEGLYEWKYIDFPIEHFYDEIDVLKNLDKHFPPCLIITSDNDFIKEHSYAMIDKLQNLNHDFEYIIFKKRLSSIHGFINIKNTAVYNISVDECLNFFKKRLKQIDK